MFGLGGGLFYMPVFMLFFEDPHTAALLSFLCILLTSGSSAIKHFKVKNVDLRLVGFLGIPMMVMVFVSGFFVHSIDQELIARILGMTLVLAGLALSFPLKTLNFLSWVSKYFYKVWPDKDFPFHPFLATPLAAILGFFCGVSGVAGGVFEIPIMIGFLRSSPHLAVGTSSLIVFLSGFLGVMSRFCFSSESFQIDRIALIFILIVVFVGAQIGSMISIRINKKVFKKICGIFIMLIGFYYIFKTIL